MHSQYLIVASVYYTAEISDFNILDYILSSVLTLNLLNCLNGHISTLHFLNCPLQDLRRPSVHYFRHKWVPECQWFYSGAS